MAGAHLSAILFWSACSGRGVAAWKRLEGLSGSSASWALNTPRNRRSYLSHLARSASPSFTSPLPPFAISYAIPPSLAPGHCCRPQLCVFFTAAVKDKKQSLPPPLLFSGRMSLAFPWFFYGYPSCFSLQRLAVLSAFSCFISSKGGTNNFMVSFIEHVIAGTSRRVCGRWEDASKTNTGVWQSSKRVGYNRGL